MLGSDSSGRPYEGVVDTFNRLLIEQNNNNNMYNSNSNYWNRYRIFFSGVGPRVMWIRWYFLFEVFIIIYYYNY